MSRAPWQIAAACLMLMAPAATVAAQEAATSFDELRALVKPGDTVTVIDTVGHAIRGSIADISSTSLTLVRSDGRKTLAESDVAKVRQWKHGNMARGAVRGAGIGAAVGAGVFGGLALSSVARGGDCGCAEYVLIGTAYFAAVGTGVGVISSARIREDVIFFRPGIPPAKVSVSPLLTRSRRGVLVTYGF